MADLIIAPVEKPTSFNDKAVQFSKDEWEAANKQGEIKVPAVTAMEALKNGRGLWRIKPQDQPKEVVIKSLKEPEEMTTKELAEEMALRGKPPRKQMSRAIAVDFIKKLRAEAVELIIDDEGEDDEDGKDDE